MIAARQAQAAGFISVAGAGQSADKVIRDQLQAQPQLVKDAAFPILDQLAQGKAVADVNPMLAALFRPSVQPYLISWFKYDPQAELRKLTVPVLLVQGTQDMQVSLNEVQLLAAAAPKSKLVEVQNMNHVLKETTSDRTANFSTYSNPTLPLASQLMPAVVAFVKSVK
jgi:pimeloyl-ACP methyl ester carboxylesterase